ncbi:hypothetical protein MW7_017185 [Imbroritus primus]|uniref:Uncharacterized protein n=1 Tax=Imbroritus primus TaxID=3058603 RepID=A0ACD3SKW5_9BURK|nr:hypothetical protein MW7_017185 [Burkholderiaceae bacterium PBA]
MWRQESYIGRLQKKHARGASAVCGVRCAVCGVRCAVCGVRCAVCGVQSVWIWQHGCATAHACVPANCLVVAGT